MPRTDATTTLRYAAQPHEGDNSRCSVSDQVRLTAVLPEYLWHRPNHQRKMLSNCASIEGDVTGQSSPTAAEGCGRTVSQLQSQPRLPMYKPCNQCRRCRCPRNTQRFATARRSCGTTPEAGHAPAAPRLPGLRAAGSSPDMLSQTRVHPSRLPATTECYCTRHAGSCRASMHRRLSNQGSSRVFRKPRKRIDRACHAP
jgi:hypothetical protein